MRQIIHHNQAVDAAYYLVFRSRSDYPELAAIDEDNKLKLLDYVLGTLDRCFHLLDAEKMLAKKDECAQSPTGVLHIIPVPTELVPKALESSQEDLKNILLEMVKQEFLQVLNDAPIEKLGVENYIVYLEKVTLLTVGHYLSDEMMKIASERFQNLRGMTLSDTLLKRIKQFLNIYLLPAYSQVEESTDRTKDELFSNYYQHLQLVFCSPRYSYITDTVRLRMLTSFVTVLETDKEFAHLKKQSFRVQDTMAQLLLCCANDYIGNDNTVLKNSIDALYQALYGSQSLKRLKQHCFAFIENQGVFSYYSPPTRLFYLVHIMRVVGQQLYAQANPLERRELLPLSYLSSVHGKSLLHYYHHSPNFLVRLKRHTREFTSHKGGRFASIPFVERNTLEFSYAILAITQTFEKNQRVPIDLIISLLHDIYSFYGMCGLLPAEEMTLIQQALFKYVMNCDEQTITLISKRLASHPVECDQHWPSSDRINYSFTLNTFLRGSEPRKEQEAITAQADSQAQRYKMVFHVTHGIHSVDKRNGFLSRWRFWQRHRCPVTIAIGVPHIADWHLYEYHDESMIYTPDFIDYFTPNSKIPGLISTLVAWHGVVKIWRIEFKGSEHFVVNIPYPDGHSVKLDNSEFALIHQFINNLYQQDKWHDRHGRMHVHTHCKWGVQRSLIAAIALRASFNVESYPGYRKFLNINAKPEEAHEPELGILGFSPPNESSTLKNGVHCLDFIKEVKRQVTLPIKSGGIVFKRFLHNKKKILNTKELVLKHLIDDRDHISHDFEFENNEMQNSRLLNDLVYNIIAIGKAIDAVAEEHAELIRLMVTHPRHYSTCKVGDYIMENAYDIAAKSPTHKQIVTYFQLHKYLNQTLLAKDKQALDGAWHEVIDDELTSELICNQSPISLKQSN